MNCMDVKKMMICSCLWLLLSSFGNKLGGLRQQGNNLKVIVIDAGHGLPDPGADGRYSHESAVALSVALKLGKQLEENLPDCKILYTRTDENLPNGLRDKDEANRWRAKFANENHADLFIAIHCNSLDPIHHSERIGTHTETYYTGRGKKRKKHTRRVPSYRYWTTPNPKQGTETYIWAVNKNDQKKDFVGSMEEDTEGGEKADSTSNVANEFFNSPEAKILASLRTRKFFDKSKLLAELVEDEFSKQGRHSLGAKQRNEKGIWVLAATAMPSILVETGFISNPEEENYLNSDKGQNEIVYAIMRAVLRYKEGGDKTIITRPSTIDTDTTTQQQESSEQ